MNNTDVEAIITSAYVFHKYILLFDKIVVSNWWDFKRIELKPATSVAMADGVM